MTDMIFQGRYVAVRMISKRNGKIGYALIRPEDRHAVLDEFTDGDYAVRIAKFIDNVVGGSYAAEHRRAAKRFASGTERVG